MSAATPTSPFDELGLDVPFAEGNAETDRFEAGPAWSEIDTSPFAEATASAGASQEGSERMPTSFEDEGLAWLDVEAADVKMESMGVDERALDSEDFHEHEHHDQDESQWEDTTRESEYLDGEERDANESHEEYAPQERVETEHEATGSGVTPLTAQQRTWVLALDRTAIEQLPDATMRTRFLGQDWSDVEFPGNAPRGQRATDEIKRHWALARSLFNAMAEVVPERRVPNTIRFRDRPVAKVPGQPTQKLYAEARDAFTCMRDAANADGVELFILSSWRSRTQQAAVSANQPNPIAAARKASAHMYGLAIDLRMGVPGLPVKEINTRVDRITAAKAGTAAKMGNLVRMYRSPVYKWMSLRAREFGWYPYRNEPWHWEYNPPGLKARFESGTSSEFEQTPHGDEATGAEASWEQVDETSIYAEADSEQEETAASPLIRTFTATALGVKVAVLVTQAARTARQVEMLVFAHGLDLCRPVFKNRPTTFITERPFRLGDLVEASGRPIVLVVPFLDWEHLDANHMAFGQKWHRLAEPDNFNQVAAEALEHARALTGSAAAPTLLRLILAGHSRAFGFFDALAHEHASPQMRMGALGRPTHVWALDTTYSAPIADWRAWLHSRDDLQATVIYRQGKYENKGSIVVRELATGIRGREFGKLAAASQGRLTVIPVAAGKVAHCEIPSAYLPRLLASLPPLPTAGELEAETKDQEFEEGEDLAGLAAEAAALASSDESISGEWTEQVAGEDEDAPARFDAFEDERDLEWGSESSEEIQGLNDSREEPAQPLSFGVENEVGETDLAGSGLTPAEQKAVVITSTFETGKRGGFYGLSGNFDGQGLSFGLVNWTIGTGSLQPLLRDFAKEHPARWVSVFGPDAARFLELIARKGEDARKEQHRFAIEQMNICSTGARGKRIWTVRQPWVDYFRRLSEDSMFQKIQVRYVRDLLARADYYCRYFGLTSEQAFTFMFDTVASHGKWWLQKKFGGVEKRRVLVEQALKTLTARFGMSRVPESEVLLAIADVLATTSAQRWADNVRRRKRWFVTGQHPRARELDGLKPHADVPYSTSRSTAGESESNEADIAGEWEISDDAHAILGKWTVWVKDWIWEYEFLPGGKVAWRDTRSNEKGVGRWSLSPKSVNMSWSDSTTTESWPRPLMPVRQKGWYKSSYYTGSYVAQKTGTSAHGCPTPVPAWADAIDPFPPSVSLSLDLSNTRMTTAFAPITVSTANHLCTALADVTGAPSSVPFASLHEDENVYVGSLSKVGVMYAAFALRARVQAFADAARANGVTTAPELFRLIECAWSPKLRALFPAHPTKSFKNNQDVTVPQVDKIFTLSPGGKIEFAIASPAITDADLDGVGDKGAPIGLFHEWMRLMMRLSNNTAAGNCILALGYFYINGLFARSGFFAAGQGLWISGDYAGHDWVKTETERVANAAGIALAPRWASAQGRRKSNFVGDALQVGRLMTAMAQDKLVDAAACAEMRRLANQLSGGIGSYAGSALTAVGRTQTALSSKIGFGDDRFSHDCVIIERAVGGKHLRYAAVVLGSAPAKDRRDLSDLFVLLDAAVVERNP